MSIIKFYQVINSSILENEDIIFLINQLDASGSYIDEEENIYCYLEDDQEIISNFKNKLLELNLDIKHIKDIQEENWVQKSEELWENLVIKNLEIIPTNKKIDKKNNEVLISPGTGFGTGHHATTSMIIELLQNEDLFKTKPRDILDFGSGSGILSLVAEKLFKNSKITAVENDPLAIDNARFNLELNDSQNIILKLDDKFNAEYDLILANIYTELLIKYENDFYSSINPDGVLILSGIMKNLYNQIENKFNENWDILKFIEKDNWMSVVLKLKI